MSREQQLGSEAASILFNRAISLTMSRQMPAAELFSVASTLKSMHQEKLIGELYKTWIAYNGDHELVYVVYFNYGTALTDAGDRAGAINAFRECIRQKPDFYPPYINLGRALEDAGLAGDAVNQWLALVNSLPTVNGNAIMHKLIAL